MAAKLPPVSPLVRFGATTIAFALGCLGFHGAFHNIGQDPPLWQILAHALRLIVGTMPAPLEGRDLPISLDIARIALPLLTLWTTFALAWLQVRNPIRLALARSRGEHIVVSGDAGLAALAAQADLARNRRVVIWADEPHAGWIAKAADHGAAVVGVGDGGSIDQLGLETARCVLIAGASDAANVSRAAAIIDRAGQSRPPGDPLAVIVRVDDRDFRTRLEDRFERAPQPGSRLRFASLPDLAARQLFIAAPLDRFIRFGITDRLVFVFGLTPAAQSYVLRMLIAGHFRDGGKPRFVIVGKDAARAQADFAHWHGNAHSLLSAEFAQAEFDRPGRMEPVIQQLCERYGDPVAIIADCGADSLTLGTAMAIDEWYRRAGQPAPPIHARVDNPPDSRLGAMIHAFGSLDQFADPDLLLQETHDELARSIHDFYLEGRLNEGERIGARASLHEWENLPERFRDDNRMIADCYQLKLRDIGARRVAGDGPPLRFDTREIEQLAQAEHDRWMAAKLAAGWVYGPVRDDEKRIHPDIVAYAQLSERIKDLDREQIRIVTRLSCANGNRALRVLNIALWSGPIPGTTPFPPLDRLLDHIGEAYPDRIPVFLSALADDAARAALAAMRNRAWRHALVLQGNADTLIDGLPADQRAETIAALRTADSLIAVASDADCNAVMDSADLIVTPLPFSEGVGGGGAPDRTASRDCPHPGPSAEREGLGRRSDGTRRITLAADGTVVAA